MQEIAGKTAVVTGAASGIGLALSRRLGSDGMRVMMADVEEPALAAAASSLTADGIEVTTHVTDVSDAGSVETLARTALDRFGAVHVVCNNAGIGAGGLAWETPLETWNWVLGVDLYGVVHGIRSFVPHLIAQGEGHVVNTASIAGLLSPPFTGPYTAAKHAVVALSESLYHDLAMIGAPVGVSVLCPGMVRTRIVDSGRNWLAKYGARPEPPDPARSEKQMQALQAANEAGLDPATVATAVRDAIVSNRFWILTHPESGDLVAGRYRRAADGRNPQLTPIP